MAVEIGTASSHQDLLAKLITFLTTSATLVGLSQNWSLLHTAGAGPDYDHLIRGPGLSGSEQIHLRVYSASSAVTDSYGIGAQGFDSYNSAVSHTLQQNMSGICGMALWNNSIPYWFIANGRRFIVVAKISTTYSTMYGGFILPYATPSEFPYPLAVMASHEDATSHRWSRADYEVGGFFDPSDGNAFFRHNDGTWLNVANYTNGSGGSRNAQGSTNVWPYNCDLGLRENLDGSNTLLPTVITSNYGVGNVYGELQDVFFVAGFGMGAEDTITVGGETYLIVQNTYRTDRRAYAAIKLV